MHVYSGEYFHGKSSTTSKERRTDPWSFNIWWLWHSSGSCRPPVNRYLTVTDIITCWHADYSGLTAWLTGPRRVWTYTAHIRIVSTARQWWQHSWWLGRLWLGLTYTAYPDYFLICTLEIQSIDSDRRCFTLMILLRWSPANIRINFSSSETRMIFLHDAENRTIVSSFLGTKHQNVMEGWTDRQTDRIALAITAVGIVSNDDVLQKPSSCWPSSSVWPSIIQHLVSAICHSTHMTEEIQLLLHDLLNYVLCHTDPGQH